MARERHAFNSDWVKVAFYDPDKRVIEIRFEDGHRHNYFGCTETMWKRFKRASSAGRFVQEVLSRRPHAPARG